MAITDYRSGRHGVFLLHVHLVFTTTYRRRVFTARHIEAMRTIFTDVRTQFDAERAEFDGETDHVHLLMNSPPHLQLSVLINSVKGVSGRELRQQFPDLTHRYWKGVLWSRSYFAGSCGDAPLDVLTQYIENQRTPD